jgi:hypothetical protein
VKAQALNLRVGRLVLDAPLGAGVTAPALAAAIRSELAVKIAEGAARAIPFPGVATPLAGTIAGGIAAKLGSVGVAVDTKSRGGGDDFR